MSAQTTYAYAGPMGVAGGLVDLSPRQIDTYLNSEANGSLGFGLGVVAGSRPGVNIALPGTTSVAKDFQGVTVNNRTTETAMDGTVTILGGAAVGVLAWGKIYVKVAAAASPSFGAQAYLVTSGAEKGCFTQDSTAGVALKARFLGAASGGIAPLELLHQMQETN